MESLFGWVTTDDQQKEIVKKWKKKDSVPQVNKLTLNKKALTNQIMKTSWGGGGAWTILDQQSP